MSRAQLKTQAKQQLGGGIFDQNWLFFVVIELIVGAIISIVSGVTFAIGTIILAGPLMFALTFISMSLVRGAKQINLEDVFAGFKDGRFGQTLVLFLMEEIFVFLWSLLFIIPGIIKSYAYKMAMYIYNDDNSKDWSTCLKESQEMMRGHKWELFVLELSFIGWIIVGSLAFGIGTLWVNVYMQQTEANFYQALKGPVVTVDSTAEVKEEATEAAPETTTETTEEAAQ